MRQAKFEIKKILFLPVCRRAGLLFVLPKRLVIITNIAKKSEKIAKKYLFLPAF
jgi:hypothetical protein